MRKIIIGRISEVFRKLLSPLQMHLTARDYQPSKQSKEIWARLLMHWSWKWTEMQRLCISTYQEISPNQTARNGNLDVSFGSIAKCKSFGWPKTASFKNNMLEIFEIVLSCRSSSCTSNGEIGWNLTFISYKSRGKMFSFSLNTKNLKIWLNFTWTFTIW